MVFSSSLNVVIINYSISITKHHKNNPIIVIINLYRLYRLQTVNKRSFFSKTSKEKSKERDFRNIYVGETGCRIET